jgi:hypothetical protein
MVIELSQLARDDFVRQPSACCEADSCQPQYYSNCRARLSGCVVRRAVRPTEQFHDGQTTPR